MADYSAKIKLLVEGLQSLDKVEAKVKEIHRLTAGGWRVDLQSSKGYKDLSKNLDDIANKGRTAAKSLKDSFKTVGSIAKGAGVAGAVVTINQFGAALESASVKAGLLGPAVQTVGSAIKTAIPGVDTLVQAFTALPPALQATAPALAAVTAGLIAFNKPIRTAIADTVTVAKGLDAVKDAVKAAFNTTLLMAFTDQLEINIDAADAYRQALLRLTDTVGDLQRRKAALQRVLNNTNSSTDTAVKIATKLVDVTQRLNNEQREQNDLLRRARGLSQTELEETKGVKSLRTRRKRTEYLKEQAEEAAKALASLRALEAAESAAARTRLAAAAKEKADALQAEKVAAQSALTALRALEAAESDLARKRLAASVKSVVDPRGTQAYEFPIGPAVNARRFKFEGDVSADRAEAALRNKELNQQRALNQQFFAEEKAQLIQIDRLREKNAQRQATRIQKLNQTIRGSLSSAAIGGAFPLLFGQSPQAAVGGAIGGLLGGQAGGFAGSLLGTALGELSAAKSRIEELGAELGFTQTQASELAKAFELAGQNSEQLQAAVTNIQGLGLSTEETASALKISNELAQEYGGKVDKIAQAFANTLESGKVSINSLNSFTAQGIPIQDELAKKFNVSRSALLEMAKDGKVAVQDVIDVLVDMGRAAEKTADDARTGFDEFTTSVKGLAIAIADAAGVILKNLVPALNTVLNQLALIIKQATNALSKLGDIQVGQAYAGIFRAAQNRGTLFGTTVSKQNIDDITQGLKTLRPATAQSSAEIAKFRQVLEAAKIELGKYGGAIGEYATATAQVEITRLQREVAAREAVLPKEPLGPSTTPITSITAPTQLTPGGAKGKDRAADNLQRAQDLLRKLEQQNALLEARTKLDEDILKISQDYDENLRNIANLEDQSLRTLQENAAVRLRNQQINDAVEKHERKVNKELDKQVKQYKNIDSIRKAAFEGYKDAEVAILQELTARAEVVKIAFDAIGQSFGNAVFQVVQGATTIKEAVADMFAAIGRALINYATQAIATYIAIGIARIFAGVGGVAKANYTGNEMGGAFMNPSFGVDSSGLAGPSSAFSSLDYAGVKFAQGGFVTGPTRALIGEGGEPEYVIPASKMRGAMNRYAAGARGSSVIPSGGEQGTGEGGTAVATPIDVRYTVERINSVDYVTADQFQAGMQQAAQQGAAQGEQRTLRRLQMSTSTRKRLGM